MKNYNHVSAGISKSITRFCERKGFKYFTCTLWNIGENEVTRSRSITFSNNSTIDASQFFTEAQYKGTRIYKMKLIIPLSLRASIIDHYQQQQNALMSIM